MYASFAKIQRQEREYMACPFEAVGYYLTYLMAGCDLAPMRESRRKGGEI